MKTMSYEQIVNQTENIPSIWMQRLGPLPMAIIMTLVLLYAMHLLVHREIPDLVEDPRPKIPDVTAKFPDKIATIEEDSMPTKPVIIEQPPSIPIEEPVFAKIETGVIGISPVKTNIPISNNPGVIVSGQPMPIVRINPHYPAAAVTKGLEGYVDVIFDITPIGTTTNIRVIGYSPSKVFNSSVIKAVRGWKYRPAADEAGAKTTLDVKERISFVMEK